MRDLPIIGSVLTGLATLHIYSVKAHRKSGICGWPCWARCQPTAERAHTLIGQCRKCDNTHYSLFPQCICATRTHYLVRDIVQGLLRWRRLGLLLILLQGCVDLRLKGTDKVLLKSAVTHDITCPLGRIHENRYTQ